MSCSKMSFSSCGRQVVLIINSDFNYKFNINSTCSLLFSQDLSFLWSVVKRPYCSCTLGWHESNYCHKHSTNCQKEHTHNNKLCIITLPQRMSLRSSKFGWHSLSSIFQNFEYVELFFFLKQILVESDSYHYLYLTVSIIRYGCT